MGTRTNEYDAYGRILWTDEATAPDHVNRTVFAYDRNDRLTAVEDGVQVIAGEVQPGITAGTAYYYDGIGRGDLTINGLGATRVEEYYAGTSRPRRVVDAAGTRVELIYNGAGELAVSTTTASQAVGSAETAVRSFRYSRRGELAAASYSRNGVAQGTVQKFYDSLGRPWRESNDALPYAVEHDYSTFAGLPRMATRLVLGTTAIATWQASFDVLGRPRTLTYGNGSSPPLATISYTAGATSSIDYGNGVRQSLVYDERGRAIGTDVTSGAMPLVRVRRGLGADSIPREVQTTVGFTPTRTALFNVDLRGRVTAENLGRPGLPLLPGDLGNASNGVLSTATGEQIAFDPSSPLSQYGLDAASNIRTRTGTSAFTATTDGANRYTDLDGSSVTHDTAGRVRSFRDESYDFDAAGQLTRASVGTALKTFEYDALGRRIAETRTGVRTLIFWDSQRVVATGSGTDSSQGSLRLRLGFGTDDTVALVSEAGGAISYVHSGLDGSTIAATGNGGYLVEAYDYTAFGETQILDPGGYPRSTSIIGNRFLFQGQLHDPELGLYSMRAREYKPAWGRFLSPDPIGRLGGPNLYAFVDARPLTHWDPTGLCNEQRRSTINGLVAGIARNQRAIEYIIRIGGPDHLNDPAYVEFQRRRQRAIDRNLVVLEALRDYPEASTYDIAEGGFLRLYSGARYESRLLLEARLPPGLGAGNAVSLFIQPGDFLAGGITSTVFPVSGLRGAAAAQSGRFLFRGTTRGYGGSETLQRIGVTPTTTDPVVATLFATESSRFGEGIVLFAPRAAVPVGEANVLAALEAEVGVDLLPVQFAARAQVVSVGEARQALKELGVSLPSRIADKAALDAALRNTPRLTEEQIGTFLEILGL